MEETKQRESVYSDERTEIATVGSPQEVTKAAESAESGRKAPVPAATQKTPMTASPVIARGSEYSQLATFLEYLKRTRRVWLILASATVGFMAVVTIAVKGVSERARIAQEKRHEEVAATVTPENLIARCGSPAGDVTKQMYPVLTRTMSYQPRENEKVVFQFSRTAEEKSDWVFLSMKDESGARSYDTPEAKTAALPCLDSKK
jgi:hypothetical protein